MILAGKIAKKDEVLEGIICVFEITERKKW